MTTVATPGDIQKVGSIAKQANRRNRASVACTQCRLRRTKCVVSEGATECDQCHRSDTKCVLRVNDERKRPTSKAYTASLSQRIELLEGMLAKVGQTPPPACHPPRTTHSFSPQDGENYVQTRNPPYASSTLRPNSNTSHSTDSSDDTSPRTSDVPVQSQGEAMLRNPLQQSGRPPDQFRCSSSATSSIGSKETGIIDKILSTTGHLAYDSASGGVRYFGPTTNFHVYADLNLATKRTASREQNKRAERIICGLSPDSYDYLMELYWSSYNSVLHVVNRKAFEEDKENEGTQNYSGFLNVCLLAIGVRFADLNRPEMQKVGFWDRESDLHREAKYLFEYELEKPGGIPSVQALLLLGDLEAGVGRDKIGWLYAGMACRLVFDLGLNLDTAQLDLSKQEVQIRQMVLGACMIYDVYWALFLGRPTTIKESDLAVSQLTGQFALLDTSQPSGATKSLETQIYSALLTLMGLATKITERVDTKADAVRIDASAYLAVAAIDRDLHRWYRRLPSQLKWSPTNIETAPFSFFLLHQQFHMALILLHRPFAQFRPLDVGAGGQSKDAADNDPEETDHYSTLSRTICFNNGIRMARIFQIYQRRFDVRKIFTSALQHVGTAVTSLIAGVTQISDPGEKVRALQHLRILAEALRDMSPTYQPAKRMSNVLEEVCQEAGWDLDRLPELLDEISTSLIPVRRTTSTEMLSSTAKRRQVVAPTENAILTGQTLSRNDTRASNGSSSTVNPSHQLPSPLGVTPATRPPATFWADPAPSNAMYLGKNDTFDFTASSDYQPLSLDNLDAFADFDLPNSEKQDKINHDQAQDSWRNSYVWQN